MPTTYYHDILGKKEPDIESMVSFLLNEGVLYVTTGTDAMGQPSITVTVVINDYFVPAADGESVTIDELPTLFELYKEENWDGVTKFVATKRKIPNKHWRDPESEFQKKR